MFHINQVHTMPVDSNELRRDTSRNSTLSKVLQLTVNGEWSTQHKHNSDLAVLWGSRVIVPPKLRDRVLLELCESHLGIVKIKCLSRSYIWWPGIDQQIEDTSTGTLENVYRDGGDACTSMSQDLSSGKYS